MKDANGVSLRGEFKDKWHWNKHSISRKTNHVFTLAEIICSIYEDFD